MKPKNQITPEEIKKYLPGVSKSTLKVNDKKDRYQGEIAKLESNPSDEPLAKKELQGTVQKRYLVRIESVRKYMLDTDNVCAKYLADLLRYSGCLPSDDFNQTTIQTTERKCREGEEEHTEIEIIDL